MNFHMHDRVNRKQFIQKMGLITILLSMSEISSEEKKEMSEIIIFSNLNQVADFLNKNRDYLNKVKTKGEWKLGKILSHCAQSIEYSLNGFPDNKSPLFQWTLGSAAFLVFSLRGKMSHGLNQPIPGAEEIADDTKIDDGIQRLLTAIAKFQSAEETSLKPHFAYGSLDKSDYDSAHTYHINNHFEELI